MGFLKDSLYANYIKEREGAEIVECAEGFITYKVVDKQCLLLDLFVKKESRKSGIFKLLFSKLEALAKKSLCEEIAARVFLVDPNHKTTILAAFSVGAEITDAHSGCIYLIKKLGV